MAFGAMLPGNPGRRAAFNSRLVHLLHFSSGSLPNAHRWRAGGFLDHASGAQMVREQLRRIAGLGRLPRREEPILGGRDLEEAVPVGRAGGRPAHAWTLSHALVSCNPAAHST